MPLCPLLLLAFLTFSSCFFPPSASADPGWKMAGVRGGFSATPKRTFYHEYEAFTVYQLPWSWRSAGGWGVTPRVEGSAGVLRGQQTNAFIGTVGPDFAFDKSGFPVEVSLGLNFAFLNSPRFGEESFEGDLQFISHIGASYRFSTLFGAGYRFQHMSHGGIYGGFNPGLNLHIFSLNVYLD